MTLNYHANESGTTWIYLHIPVKDSPVQLSTCASAMSLNYQVCGKTQHLGRTWQIITHESYGWNSTICVSRGRNQITVTQSVVHRLHYHSVYVFDPKNPYTTLGHYYDTSNRSQVTKVTVVSSIIRQLCPSRSTRRLCLFLNSDLTTTALSPNWDVTSRRLRCIRVYEPASLSRRLRKDGVLANSYLSCTH